MTKKHNVLPKSCRAPLKGLSVSELKPLIGTNVHKVSGKPFQNGERLAVVSDVKKHSVTGRPAFVFDSFGKYECEAQGCIPAHKVTIALYKELLDMKQRFRFC